MSCDPNHHNAIPALDNLRDFFGQVMAKADTDFTTACGEPYSHNVRVAEEQFIALLSPMQFTQERVANLLALLWCSVGLLNQNIEGQANLILDLRHQLKGAEAKAPKVPLANPFKKT